MKRISHLIVLLTLTSMLFTCSKQDEKYVTREQIKELANRQKQVVAFQALSPEQQYKVMSEKLDQILTQKMPREQRTLVEELKNKLTPNAYSKGNKEFQQFIENDWLKRAMNVFTTEELRVLFGRIEDVNIEGSGHINLEHPVQTVVSRADDNHKHMHTGQTQETYHCDCNLTSVFGCGLDLVCTDTECHAHGDNGCGFLWLYRCEGLCCDPSGACD